MITTGRKAASVVMLMFIAWGAIISGTRLSALAVAAQPAAATQKPPSATDPDDQKLAGHFSGRVTGSDGKPLSGARVFIVPRNGADQEATKVRAKTDADGRFEFDAPDMTYTELDGLTSRREGLLIATAAGYGPDCRHTSGLDRLGLRTYFHHWDQVTVADVNLQLVKDDVPIHGRFLDPDGRPLAGARVRLDRIMIPQGGDLTAHLNNEKKRSPFTMVDFEREIDPLEIPGLKTETRTDAEGQFTFTGIGRERLAILSVSEPSVVNTNLTVMTRDAPDVALPGFKGRVERVIHGAGCILQLKPGLTIKGMVRDRDTHAPIPGMWVTWRRNPLRDPASTADAPVTDEKGRFTISGLDPELWNWEKTNRVVTAFPRPGGQYLLAEGVVEPGADVVIECMRGIPFRLKLVDEKGKPVDATVEYQYVNPNPHIADLVKPFIGGCSWPIRNRAARRADGTYEGFVLPGPGALLVKTPDRSYRPAHVNPKAFFEPGRTKWTAQEQISSYGTNNTLQIGGEWTDQHDYAAIVLVNPPLNSKPLELSATVVKDKPRQVSLIDPDGKPVIGAQSEGLMFEGWGGELTLRAASFPLTKLHPDRARRITFIKEDRQLIGFLMARGDGETPYTVRMQPWGTVTGRFVDENGKQLPADAQMSLYLGGFGFETNTDAEVGEYAKVTVDSNGRFRVERMVPSQRYTAKIYRGRGLAEMAGMAFENLAVRPGEVRDLGDISVLPAAASKSRTKPKN